jgi:hypothetical protein
MAGSNFKPIRMVSDPIRKAAEGQDCTLMTQWCNNDPTTTVHCHIRRGGDAGANQKPHDILGYHGCSECHAHEDEVSDWALLMAMKHTINRLIQMGIVTAKGMK